MRLAEVPNGGIFRTEDGAVFVKLMNPTLRPLQDVSSHPGWAADIGNGQIVSTLWMGETVEFLGLGYNFVFPA